MFLVNHEEHITMSYY